MTGFRLPAEAVEAGYTALDYENGLWLHNPAEGVWTLIARKRVAECVLSAALPVLAESPELIERLARRIYDGRMLNDVWDDLAEHSHAFYRAEARGHLRDLFAAAPTEENTDG